MLKRPDILSAVVACRTSDSARMNSDACFESEWNYATVNDDGGDDNDNSIDNDDDEDDDDNDNGDKLNECSGVNFYILLYITMLIGFQLF